MTDPSTTTQLATFHLDGELFGVTVCEVQEVLLAQPCTPTPGAPAAIRGLINLRGQVVTAMDLRARLGLPASPADAVNLVVRHGDEAWSLLVDRIGDVVEVDDADFESTPDTLHGPLAEVLRGVYKLDGRLLLALDVARALTVPVLAAP